MLRTIVLPYLKPALIGAAAISFLMSFENFNTTLMLVGSDPPLTVMMYGRMREGASPVLNAVSLVFYLGSLALRLNGGDRARARTLSATGYLISATAAYVGGDLVFATGQAVNRNAWVDGPEDYTDLAASQDLADGKMHKYDLDGKAVVLLRDDDGLHAFNGTCPHLGGPLIRLHVGLEDVADLKADLAVALKAYGAAL